MESEPTGYITTPSIDVPYYYSNIVSFFTDHSPVFFGAIKSFMGVIIGLSIPLSVFLVIAIVIVVEGLKKIRRLEEEKYSAKVEPAYTEEKVDPELGRRWKTVLEHVDSPNPNDWKQAIIEADVLLENLVAKLGYQGETLGEKLKRTTTGDFKSRDAAWEAHLVRNRIAHDGSAFDLNQFEAKRVISLYRKVFDEFYKISE